MTVSTFEVDDATVGLVKEHPSFSGLPNELKQIVMGSVDDDSLPNLRLTCKTLCELTNKPFGQRCLAHRRFLISKHSLQGLVDLTAHPVLGPCVQSVLLATHRLTSDVRDWRESNGRDMHKTIRDAKHRHIHAIYNKMADFVRSRQAVELLSQAMMNLNNHGNQVTFGVYDDVIDRDDRSMVLRKAYGWNEVWGDFAPDLDLDWTQWKEKAGTVFRYLSTAAVNSQYTLVNLELDLAALVKSYRSLHDRVCQIVLSDPQNNTKVLNRDVEVRIKLAGRQEVRLSRTHPNTRDTNFWFRGKVISKREPITVHSRFALCPRMVAGPGNIVLWDFDTAYCPLFNPRTFGDIGGVSITERFHSVRFEMCCIGAVSLLHFLAEQEIKPGATQPSDHDQQACPADEIRELELINIRLEILLKPEFLDRDENPWPLMEEMSEVFAKLRLKKLVLENVYVDNEALDRPSVAVVEGKHEWHGIDAIHSGFRQFVEDAKVRKESEQLREEQENEGEIDT